MTTYNKKHLKSDNINKNNLTLIEFHEFFCNISNCVKYDSNNNKNSTILKQIFERIIKHF